MDIFFTYVLQSEKDDKFYNRYTNNLERRFKEHMTGKVNSTRDRVPLKLIYSEACLSQKDALHREKYSLCRINQRFSFAIQQGKKAIMVKCFYTIALNLI